MKLNNYKHLQELSVKSDQNRILFTFDFHTMRFKCLFFRWRSTFLISYSKAQKAHMFALNEYGGFNGKLPKDFYFAITKELEDCTGLKVIAPIWEALDVRISKLTSDDVETHTNDDVSKYVSQTSTKDKEFDKEGMQPFFKNWRRNNERQVSSDNLEKTERLFGKEFRDRCYMENVSSVWSSVPSDKSDEFLREHVSFV